MAWNRRLNTATLTFSARATASLHKHAQQYAIALNCRRFHNGLFLLKEQDFL